VVYIASPDEDFTELYSVPITGGTPFKLNDKKHKFISSDFQINDDRVVYRAENERKYVYELYSVPISGGKVIKLNNGLENEEEVSEFQIIDDRVIYLAGESNFYNLYSVPITGGTPFKLNSSTGVLDFQVEGDRVVFRKNKTS